MHDAKHHCAEEAYPFDATAAISSHPDPGPMPPTLLLPDPAPVDLPTCYLPQPPTATSSVLPDTTDKMHPFDIPISWGPIKEPPPFDIEPEPPPSHVDIIQPGTSTYATSRTLQHIDSVHSFVFSLHSVLSRLNKMGDCVTAQRTTTYYFVYAQKTSFSYDVIPTDDVMIRRPSLLSCYFGYSSLHKSCVSILIPTLLMTLPFLGSRVTRPTVL
jgi:hypothetical protein